MVTNFLRCDKINYICVIGIKRLLVKYDKYETLTVYFLNSLTLIVLMQAVSKDTVNAEEIEVEMLAFLIFFSFKLSLCRL